MTAAGPDRAVMSPTVMVLAEESTPGPVFIVPELFEPDVVDDDAPLEPLEPQAAAPMATAAPTASTLAYPDRPVNRRVPDLADVIHYLLLFSRLLSSES